MADEKDRLGAKLRDKGKGEEDRYFAEREKAALERLRKGLTAEQQADVREVVLGRCPRDSERLETVQHTGVQIDRCPKCEGVWLDKGELETIAQRESDSWLGRLLGRKA